MSANRISYLCATCEFNNGNGLNSGDSLMCCGCSGGSNYSQKPHPPRKNNSIKYENYKPLKIENVIFKDPATIVFWSDNTKTVVKAKDETFDKEKGLAMAISKKFAGNNGNYYNIFKKWIMEE